MNNKCIFCDRSNFEERIVWENEGFYIIVSLGQITDGGYLLLIPKEHARCIGSVKSRYFPKVDILSKKITRDLMSEYGVPSVSVFEHGIVGQSIEHAHIHFLPAECEVGEKLRKAFPYRQVSPIYSWARLKSLYRAKKHPYLVWHDRSQMDPWKTVLWNPGEVQQQYMRNVFAEALGRLERRDYKNMNSDLDKRLVLETVERMKKYFVETKKVQTAPC